MRAVVFRAEGVVEVAERPVPAIEEPADAIVRVTRAGICGSDLHFFHGKAPMDPGTTMGHEAVGIVERVGDGVTMVRPGDRVVTSFHIACGACWFCRSGQSGLCEDHRILGGGPFGGDLPGTQAQAVRVADLVGGGDPGADRPMRVERLAHRPGRDAELPVAHGHVVHHQVAGDHLARLLPGDVPAAPADHEAELSFVVEDVGGAGQVDRVLRAHHAGGLLVEDRGVLRRLQAGLRDVVGVVEADRQKFGRAQDRRVQREGGQRQPAPRTPGCARGAAQRRRRTRARARRGAGRGCAVRSWAQCASGRAVAKVRPRVALFQGAATPRRRNSR